MRIALGLLAPVVAGAMLISTPASANPQPPGGAGGCQGQISGIVGCDIGTPEQGGGPGGGDQAASGNQAPGNEKPKPTCKGVKVDPQPPAGSAIWDGHKPGDGAIYLWECVDENGDPADFDFGIVGGLVPGIPFWAADPPEANAPDPAVLAQRAVDSMRLGGPDIVSPKASGNYTVGVPVWMHVGQSATTYGPNTASASAGGMTVTAIAKVSKIVWSMGDGTSVTCTGRGTAYDASQGFAESPDCGHTYTTTSAGEGERTVTATATWSVTWQVDGGGESGTLSQTHDSQVQIPVGEGQVVGSN